MGFQFWRVPRSELDSNGWRTRLQDSSVPVIKLMSPYKLSEYLDLLADFTTVELPVCIILSSRGRPHVIRSAHAYVPPNCLN